MLIIFFKIKGVYISCSIVKLREVLNLLIIRNFVKYKSTPNKNNQHKTQISLFILK